MDKLKDKNKIEKNNFNKKIIRNYISNAYRIDNLEVIDHENQNYGYDLIVSSKSFSLTIEYKTRYFYSNDKNGKFIYKNDILIELYQSMNLFKNKDKYEIRNQNINTILSSYDINIAIGWFYKCSANRLIYIKLLDDNLYILYDIDFYLLKQWLLTNIDNFNLQYSEKTTGTINLVVPINTIPEIMIMKYKETKKRRKI